MDTEWVIDVLGKPWVAGTAGPDEFDCWGLLCWYYDTKLGIQIDHYGKSMNPKDMMSVCRFAFSEAGSPRWARVSKPEHGDAVAMSQNRRISHVGIYLDIDGGKILHSRDHIGVMLQSTHQLRASGINTILYYRYDNHTTLSTHYE